MHGDRCGPIMYHSICNGGSDRGWKPPKPEFVNIKLSKTIISLLYRPYMLSNLKYVCCQDHSQHIDTKHDIVCLALDETDETE